MEGTYSWKVGGDTGEGIEGTQWDLEAGRNYAITAWVYPVSGSVKMQVSGVSATFPQSSGNGAWEKLTLVLDPVAASEGHTLQFVAAEDSSVFYVDAVTINVAQRIIQKRGKHSTETDYLAETDFTFQADGDNVTRERTAGRDTIHHFNGSLYRGADNPAGEGSGTTQDASFRPDNQTDANGNSTQLAWSSNGKLLDSVTDAEGNITNFGYDYADRLFTSEDAENRVTVYSYADSERQPIAIRVTDGSNLVTNGDIELDGSWTAISGAAPSTNQWHTTAYAGTHSRRVVATAGGQGIESVGIALTEGVSYHLLAHVRPVSGQAKMQLGNVTQLSGDGTDTWEVLSLSYTPSSSATETVQFMAEGVAAEFYVDAVFVWSQTQVLRWQEFVYDSKGRVTDEQLLDPADGTTLLQHTKRTFGTTGNANGLLETIVQKNIEAAGVDETTTTYTYDAQGASYQDSTIEPAGDMPVHVHRL